MNRSLEQSLIRIHTKFC